MGMNIEEKITGEPGTKGKFSATELNTIVNVLSGAMAGEGVDGLKDAIAESKKPNIKLVNVSGNTYTVEDYTPTTDVNRFDAFTGLELYGINVISPFDINDANTGLCIIDTINFPGANGGRTLTSTTAFTVNTGMCLFLLNFDNNTFSVVDNRHLVSNADSISIGKLSISSDTSNHFTIGLDNVGMSFIDAPINVNGVDYTPDVYNYLLSDDVKEAIHTFDGNSLLGKDDIETATMKDVTIPITVLDNNGIPVGPVSARELTVDGVALVFTNKYIYIKDDNGNYIFTGDKTSDDYLNIGIDFIADITTGTTDNNQLYFKGSSLTYTIDGVETTAVFDPNVYTTIDLPVDTVVSIKGLDITVMRFKGTLTQCHIEKNYKQTSAYAMFSSCNLLKTFTANPRTFGNVTNMKSTWSNCRALTSFPLIDTSSVTDMSYTWYYNNNLTSFPSIDTSSATDMSYAWCSCTKLTSFPLIDTSSVTTMYYAWGYCRGLTSFPLIDSSNVTSISSAWNYCRALTSFPLIDTSSVTNMTRAWYYCTSLTSFPLINTSNVTSMYYAWGYCSALTSFPLLDTSGVTNITRAWFECNNLTSFPSIDTSSVTNMGLAWYKCNALISFPLIDTSSVTSMGYAWAYCASLICMGGFTRNGNTPYSYAPGLFDSTPALLRPDDTEQTTILNGNSWTNPTSC